MSLDIDAIRARVDAATEGPWVAGTLDGHAADVFTAESDDDLGRLVICEHAGTDAEFIAHARTDVPALLDENARLRAALDAVKALADETSEVWDGHLGTHLAAGCHARQLALSLAYAVRTVIAAALGEEEA